MSWCQDDFSYQWNILKADILGLGPLLISPAPIPSCLNPLHSGPKASIVWLASALPNSFFSVHIPSSYGRWWCQGAGGFQHPRLAGPCQDQLSAFTIWEEENGIKIRPKAKAVLSWSLWSCLFFFFKHKTVWSRTPLLTDQPDIKTSQSLLPKNVLPHATPSSVLTVVMRTNIL